MTEQERFHFGYVCGDTGLIDEQAEHQWFIENCCSITDLKKNWKTVCDKLNELNEENEELKKRNKISLYKVCDLLNGLYEEIEELKEKDEVMEKVLENMGFTVEYDNQEKRWRIE